METTTSKSRHGAIEIDGFTLNYSIEGRGPDTLVIGSSIYYPRTFSQNLRDHLRMVFVDHRGFGKANRGFDQRAFELETIVDDIEAVRQKLSLGKVNIIGHSGHGYIALEYAKKYPDAVSHVVIIAMSPDSGPKSVAIADKCFQETASPERKELLAKTLTTLEDEIKADPMKAFITRCLKFGPMIWYDPHFDASPLWRDVDVIPEMFDYLWGKVFPDIDITKNIDKLSMPVLLMLGRYDYWNPPLLWEAVQSKFKDLTIRTFEKSGHTPQLEEADLFDAELLKWLEEK